VGASWYELRCGNCGVELPPRGNKRRRVPRLGGKLKIVCEACAKSIDRQQTLESDADVPKVGLHRPPLRGRRIA
jgi:hypothetical protein